MLNPYSNLNFIEVIWTFFIRMGMFLFGQLSYSEFATDEIQILVLVFVASTAALVGSYLILRKMTMLANALSHTILLGIVIAFFLFSPTGYEHAHSAGGGINIQMMLFASILMGLVTAFLTDFLSKVMHLQEDASIGLVFSSLFALGVILVTALTRNSHIGIEVVMGNVDALHADDLKMVALIFIINFAIMILFFKEYTITTFDPPLANALGISTLFFDYLLMVQVSGTVVGAFRAVGVIMVLALITGPPLTARLLTHRLKRMLAIAVFIGFLASLFGVALSRHILTTLGIPLSTGGLVVCMIILFYILAVIFAPEQGIIAKYRHRKKLIAKFTIET